MQEVEDEQEEDEEELDAGRARSVFKYARPPPSNLCTATNISKSFPPSLLRPLPPSPPAPTVVAERRKEDDSLPRESHGNNAGGKVPGRESKRQRGGERSGLREDTSSEQSGAGSRKIYSKI